MRIDALQVGGSTQWGSLVFMILTCDYFLIVEEVYAAAALCSDNPVLRTSLRASDVFKSFAIIMIILGLALVSAGDKLLLSILRM